MTFSAMTDALQKIRRFNDAEHLGLADTSAVIKESCKPIKGVRIVCDVDKLVDSSLKRMERTGDGRRVVCFDMEQLGERDREIVDRLRDSGFDALRTSDVFVDGVQRPVCITMPDKDYRKAKRFFKRKVGA